MIVKMRAKNQLCVDLSDNQLEMTTAFFPSRPGDWGALYNWTSNRTKEGGIG